MQTGKREDNSDHVANRYALYCFCITMAGLFTTWILNQLNIFIVEKQIMNHGLLISGILFVLCLTICKIFGLQRSEMKYILLFFITAIFTVIEVTLTYHAVLLSVIPLVCSSMYRETKKMVFYAFLLTIISIMISVYTGYRIGVCDANMALLTSQPLPDYITANGTFALNQINPNPGQTLFLFFVFPRIVLCGVFVPLCINISRIISDSRLKEEEMRMLAEIDGMTGLYNKSKYLDLVSNTYRAEEKISVIYWDVNGLKKVNDTLGHEVGDRLILAVSDSIKQITSPTERAYRVGGDEFVMILRGANEKAVREKIQSWQDLLSAKQISDGVSVSAAYGYASGSGSELESLIKKADEMMYQNKREYHAKEEH